MKIAVGCDHGGYEIKQTVTDFLAERGIEIDDVGCFDTESVDYPDFALAVVRRMLGKGADEGILICKTGLGMAMTANKFPQIRAALCCSPDMAAKARTHNDANVLVLGSSLASRSVVKAILEQWFDNGFSEVERHARRVGKIGRYAQAEAGIASVAETDPDIHEAVCGEMARQQDAINLIASENYVTPAVREVQASVLTNKYAEGYPGRRWYNGCRHIDTVEALTIERAQELFGAEHANVQPHCGSSANMAVYFSVLDPGDTILAMKLDHGGHLTHGHEVNFSGRLFSVRGYGVDQETERIDYDAVATLAEEHRPRMIVVGASAYPRQIDFERFRAIADDVNAYLMVDMAHIAGLVAGGSHPSPVPFADFVTTTTHKTLRGPRGGMILCRQEFAADLDKQVFPGVQGGPLMHTIAAKAVCLKEAMDPSFKAYAEQIVKNAACLASAFATGGLRLVSGGTDNHLLLIDLSSVGLAGRDAANALEKAGVVVNKNTIPFDRKSPFITSGIRIGTPAVTTRGMREPEMETIAGLIMRVLENLSSEETIEAVRTEVESLAARFPVW